MLRLLDLNVVASRFLFSAAVVVGLLWSTNAQALFDVPYTDNGGHAQDSHSETQVDSSTLTSVFAGHVAVADGSDDSSEGE